MTLNGTSITNNDTDLDTEQTTASNTESYHDRFSNNHIRQFRQAMKQNNRKRNQICLQRLSQRIKKSSGFFWSGYMFYCTTENPEVI